MTETTVPPTESLRARKRRETMHSITAAGIRLFIANGYEATTLDAIAAEAGISRRTFFYYFKSKDDILLASQSGMGGMLASALREQPPDQRPLDALRHAVIASCALYTPQDMIVLDRIMRSSATIQSRKQASYVEHEKTLFAALRERWPDPARETALRLLAMLSIGAVRLSLDTWSRAGGNRPIEDVLNETFDALEGEIRDGTTE